METMPRLLPRCPLFKLLFCLMVGGALVDGFNNAANNFSHLRLAQLVPPRTSQIIPTNSKVSRQASITTDAIFSNKEEYEKKHRIIVQKEKSMVPASTFNLIKAIIGSGVLALPAGVAAMSDHKKSLSTAVALISFLGVLSAYTFSLYGRLVHLSQAKSLGELWEKEKGKKSAWLISVASMTFCFGACLSYSIMLGDTFSALAKTGGLTGLGAARPFWILLVTSTVLFPLCNLQSLLALAPLSILGVFAIFFTTAFLGWRCPVINMSSPYGAASGGALLDTLASHQLPKFDTMCKGFGSPSSMILGGMAASAYLGHFSAPGFYHSVRNTDSEDRVNPTKSRKALLDFFKVTLGGFGVVTLINCLVMAFGYLTFGGNANGVILNNFSTEDVPATICRLLMAVCVMGGYPFLLDGCRTEMIELWKRKSKTEPTRRLEKTITTSLLAILAALSIVMKNAGFVIGFNGALMGSAMVYIFPSLLFLEHTKRTTGLSKLVRLERWFCRLLVGFGVTAALMGGGVSVIDAYFPALL